MTPLPLPLALADELYRRGETRTPRTVADELVRMHQEIEATDRQVEILTDELTKCSKAYGGLQAENAKLREALLMAKVWLPILIEAAGLDADETSITFDDFPDGRPSIRVSIADALSKIDTALARTGEKT